MIGGQDEDPGEGAEFFQTPSYGYPKPDPALVAYMDYLSLDEKPDIHEPGSGRLWRVFRMINSMYSKWQYWKQDDKKGKAIVMKGRSKGNFEDFWIPTPPKDKSSSSRGKGADAP